MGFFIEGSIIMDYGLVLVRRKGLKLKCLNDGFVSYKHTAFHFKMLMDWLESCGLLWYFYQLLELLFLMAPILFFGEQSN